MLRPARPPTPTLSPALGPTRNRQKPDGASPQNPGELCGQAPSWQTLSLHTGPSDPDHIPALPGPAWPGWHCHLPPGPSVDSAGSRAEPSPSVCVYVCGATSPPAPGWGPHTHGMRALAGLGTWPQSSCLSWTLCKHFCACRVGAHLRGLALSLRDWGPARRGAAPRFRHMNPTWARAHACLACHLTRMSPHTHLMLYTWRLLMSHTRCQSTSVCHMLPFSHPPRDTQRGLLPDPPPAPAVRSPARWGV